MLAKIGVKVNLVAQSKAPHFPLIQKDPPETEFYLLGWGVPTYDSHYIFSSSTTRAPARTAAGTPRATPTPRSIRPIESLTQEVDAAKRNATIAEIWKTLQDGDDLHRRCITRRWPTP